MWILAGACLLAGGYRIPLACMLLVAESTGNLVLTVVGLAAIAMGQVMMKSDSVSNAKHDARA